MKIKSIEKLIDGNDILYHYLQKQLYNEDVWFFQMLTVKLVTQLGIWIDTKTYSEVPILRPNVIRDQSARKSKTSRTEEWGSSNQKGYIRDDNSLIKGLVKNMKIISSKEIYSGDVRLGNGYTASHVWRKTKNDILASKDNKTNSFVPNLLWLPKQVAKLTDREGSFAQEYIQALSCKLFRDVEVQLPLRGICADIWEILPCPKGIPKQGLPDISELNFFEYKPSFVSGRKEEFRKIIHAIEIILQDKKIEKLICSRYTATLPLVSKSELIDLRDFLKNFI